jgi:hypothetical protein
MNDKKEEMISGSPSKFNFQNQSKINEPIFKNVS